MCAYVSCCVNVCCLVAKNLKNHIELNFSNRICKSSFLLHDLDLHFKGQTCSILFVLQISRKWWKVNLQQTLLCHSKRKSVVCHRMTSLRILYIIFLTYLFNDTILNVNISKTVRASEKCTIMTFIEVDIRHRMDRCKCTILCELDLDFQGQQFVNVNFLKMARASAKVRETTLRV